MKPKRGFAINPPVKIPWKGRTLGVRNAQETIDMLQMSGDEVDAFLGLVAEKAPQLISDGNPSMFMAMVNFVRAWLASDGELEEPEEVERRTNICHACKERVTYGLGCVGCSALSQTLMKAPKIEKLKGSACNKCRCYLSVKVSMKPEVLAADKRQIDYPENCWVPEAIKKASSGKGA